LVASKEPHHNSFSTKDLDVWRSTVGARSVVSARPIHQSVCQDYPFRSQTTHCAPRDVSGFGSIYQV